jgi:hypothetical protein
MRLMGSGRPPATVDVAAALSAAAGLLGQRPAITGVVQRRPVPPTPTGTSDGRRELGFVSLAGWVAKGANLLHGELGLGAGDRIGIGGPPGWPLAAVTLSAWWLGLTIIPTGRPSPDGGPGPSVVVTHVDAPGAPAAGTHPVSSVSALHLVIGDALDGTGGEGALDVRDAGAEWWTEAVTPHGDRPPPPAHDGDLVALLSGDGTAFSQRELLGRHADDTTGVIGLLRVGDEDLLVGPDVAGRLTALVLRPLVTGSATVVVDRDDPAREDVTRSERVTRWLD